MKKVLAIAAALAVGGPIMAHEAPEVIATEYESMKEVEEIPPLGKSNWFVSAGVGPQIFFGDHDRQCKLGDRISPDLDIAVGKWLTPGIGLRLMYSGLYAKGATQNGVYQSGGPISGKPWHGYWLNESKFDLSARSFQKPYMAMMYGYGKLYPIY